MSIFIIPLENSIVYDNIGDLDKMNKKWTPEAIQFLQDNYEKLDDEALATELIRFLSYKPSIFAIAKKRTRLKLKRKRGRPYNRVATSVDFIDANFN
jgi:hypothetical protein